jgi:transcriptional regulator with XRE-family HTH domain
MNDTLNSRTAANIRAELARRRITQEEFAERLGMGRTSVTAMLLGQTAITLPKLERIAELLEMEPSKLLND